MADDRVGGSAVFILGDELLGTGKGHLVDVLLHFVGGHADAGVGDGEGFLVFIELDFDFGAAGITGVFPRSGHHRQLLDRVYGVRHQLSQKNFVLGVERFFDNRKNILGMNRDIALFQNRRHGGAVVA